VLKILILGLNFHPEPTGIGKYTSELAAYLAAQGHLVRAITTPPYYPYWRLQPGYKAWRYQKETWNGVEILRCPLWVPRQPTGLTRLIHLGSFALSSLPALIGQFGWEPDVVLCIAPALMNAPFALTFARLSRAKAWLHIQDFELDTALKLRLLPGGNSLSKLTERLERALLNAFDQISTISTRMLTHLHEKGLPQIRTSLFPNWVNTKQVYPMLEEVNQLRTTLDLSPDQLVVLYAGTMGKKQGLESLLLTARHLQTEARIQFILSGDGAVRSELVAAARGSSNVRFLSVQPPEKLNQLLNTADIHVLLQKADAADLVMPSKLSGMLASGKPVIATANANTELGQVLKGIGVLVVPEDSSALAEAILQLARSPAKREELGNKGREYAIRHWDTEIVLGQFERRLRGIVKNN
jgi:colanic acid biosynthesis glycosyl transferase WcaI